jgi:hypothetical protein
MQTTQKMSSDINMHTTNSEKNNYGIRINNRVHFAYHLYANNRIDVK